jgi:hypothetical protein
LKRRAPPVARQSGATKSGYPEERVGRRPRGAVQHLAASIAEAGLLHTLTVTPDGRLVAVLHPLAALRALGWARVRVIDANTMTREIASPDEDLVPQEPSVHARTVAERRRRGRTPGANEGAGRPPHQLGIVGTAPFTSDPSPI